MDLSGVSTADLVKELKSRSSEYVDNLNRLIHELKLMGVKLQDIDGDESDIVFEATTNPVVVTFYTR